MEVFDHIEFFNIRTHVSNDLIHFHKQSIIVLSQPHKCTAQLSAATDRYALANGFKYSTLDSPPIHFQKQLTILVIRLII